MIRASKHTLLAVALAIWPAIASAKFSETEMASYRLGRQILWYVHGQGPPDPIAVELEKCEGQHGDTRGMTECLWQAANAYEAALNDVYKLALQANDERTREALRDAQEKWASFKEAERSAQVTYAHAENRGTIIGIAIGIQMVSAIRERIAELMMYLGADQG